MFRGLPFLRLEIAGHVVGGDRSTGDGHEYVLQVGSVRPSSGRSTPFS
jgi:hypothetical protein